MQSNLWWKLTVEWPCVLGDWLWAYIAVPLVEKLTFKRVVYLAAFTLLMVAFAQIVSVDLAVVWAGDATFYFEMASAVMFFVVRGQARQILHAAERQIRTAARAAAATMRRYAGAIRQRRNANALSRKTMTDRSKQTDDEDASRWGGIDFAFA